MIKVITSFLIILTLFILLNQYKEFFYKEDIAIDNSSPCPTPCPSNLPIFNSQENNIIEQYNNLTNLRINNYIDLINNNEQGQNSNNELLVSNNSEYNGSIKYHEKIENNYNIITTSFNFSIDIAEQTISSYGEISNELRIKMNKMMNIYVIKFITQKYYNNLLQILGFGNSNEDNDLMATLKDNFVNTEYNLFNNEENFIINPYVGSDEYYKIDLNFRKDFINLSDDDNLEANSLTGLDIIKNSLYEIYESEYNDKDVKNNDMKFKMINIIYDIYKHIHFVVGYNLVETNFLYNVTVNFKILYKLPSNTFFNKNLFLTKVNDLYQNNTGMEYGGILDSYKRVIKSAYNNVNNNNNCELIDNYITEKLYGNVYLKLKVENSNYINKINEFLNTEVLTGIYPNSEQAFPIVRETDTDNSPGLRKIKDIYLGYFNNEYWLSFILNIMNNISTCFYHDFNTYIRYYQTYFIYFCSVNLDVEKPDIFSNYTENALLLDNIFTLQRIRNKFIILVRSPRSSVNENDMKNELCISQKSVELNNEYQFSSDMCTLENFTGNNLIEGFNNCVDKKINIDGVESDFIDSTEQGRDCEWYHTNEMCKNNEITPYYREINDNPNRLTARNACCVCGGGIITNQNSFEPSPSPSETEENNIIPSPSPEQSNQSKTQTGEEEFIKILESKIRNIINYEGEMSFSSNRMNIKITLNDLDYDNIPRENIETMKKTLIDNYYNYLLELYKINQNESYNIDRNRINIIMFPGSLHIILQILPKRNNEITLTKEEKDFMEFHNFRRVFMQGLEPKTEYEFKELRRNLLNRLEEN